MHWFEGCPQNNESVVVGIKGVNADTLRENLLAIADPDILIHIGLIASNKGSNWSHLKCLKLVHEQKFRIITLCQGKKD